MKQGQEESLLITVLRCHVFRDVECCAKCRRGLKTELRVSSVLKLMKEKGKVRKLALINITFDFKG